MGAGGGGGAVVVVSDEVSGRAAGAEGAGVDAATGGRPAGGYERDKRGGKNQLECRAKLRRNEGRTDLSELLPDSPMPVLLDLDSVGQSENTQIRMREDSVISSLLGEGGNCNETKGRKSQLDVVQLIRLPPSVDSPLANETASTSLI